MIYEMREMGKMGKMRGESGLYSTVNRYKRLSRELDIFTLLGLTHCNGILSS